jgi:hypothetical protein
MKQLYDITPPPELVWEWTALANEQEDHEVWSFIATQAARWGADQELEACCEWLREFHQSKRPGGTENLRRSRRPKPPSLKEQALKALTAIEGDFNTVGDRADTIRRALEALDD